MTSEFILEINELKANINEIEIASDYLLRALSDLDSLFGKNNIEDRLEVIFRKFCIGK